MEQKIFAYKGKSFLLAIKFLAQILLVMGVFGMLYFFLIIGFALGFKM